MKILLFILLSTFIAFSNFSFAQDINFNQDDNISSYDDEKGYFSIAAGYTANLKFINTNELDNISNKFSLPKIAIPIFTNGFELKTSTIIFKNLNFGFITSSSEVIQNADTLNPVSKEIYHKQLSLNFDNIGFMLDYAINPFKSFSINPGVNISFSKMQIQISQTKSDINYNDITPINLQDNYFHSFSKDFIIIEPKISIEYAITNFLMFRATTSYSIALDNFITNKDWTYNSTGNLFYTPSDLSPSGLNIQLGLFLGLMNF